MYTVYMLITRLKCQTLMWFYRMHKLHGPKTFVLYEKRWGSYKECCKPPKQGTAVTWWGYGENEPQWILCDGEDMAMLTLRGDPLVCCVMPFDFMQQLCIDVYDWDWGDDGPPPELDPEQTLKTFGSSIGQCPEDRWVLDAAKTPEEVLENLLKRNSS